MVWQKRNSCVSPIKKANTNYLDSYPNPFEEPQNIQILKRETLKFVCHTSTPHN